MGMLFRLSFIFVLLVPGLSFADKQSQAEFVRKVVAQNVDELVIKFNEERDFYETDPKRFFDNMDEALSKIVDFRRIAARVMGKYARKADKSQRDRFVSVFKNSLYQTYTRALVESGNFEINVVKATLNSRSDKRASVDLEVVSDNGTVYPVIYSMYKNKKDEWLLENVIVFGVNIGLAFRDRFESQMRSNKNNVDAVINSWTVDLEIKQPKQG